MKVDNLFNIEIFHNLDVHDVEFEKECIKISEGVQSSKATIVQLVEQLESLLTDKDPERRQQGTYVLSNVLNALPRDFLLENQLSFIATFYCDRLKDHYKVIPAVVKGVLALVQCTLPGDHVKKLFNALFQNISCQQQQQQVRNNIYNIFQICWNKYKYELQNMHSEFVYGVISFIDGERDPRNLQFLFNWLPHFLKDVELGHLVDDMFEIVSCYFPVSFKPCGKEEQEVTRDNLANALLQCLIARKDFAENSISLALENLASSLKESKIDSLKLLEEGSRNYEPDVYLKHSEILAEIQKEIFTTQDNDILMASLDAFKVIVSGLSKCSENSFKARIQNILDTIQGNLLPEARLFDSSIAIIIRLVEAAKTSYSMVSRQIIPLLINTYNITNIGPQQAILLDRLANIMIHTKHLEEDDIDEETKKIPILCLHAIQHDSKDVRCCAYKSLTLLAEYLNDPTRTILYSSFVDLLKVALNTQEETNAVLLCFKSLAEKYPIEVETNILKRLKVSSVAHMQKYLTIYATLIHIGHFRKISLQKLLDSCVGKLDSQCKIAKSEDVIDISKFALNLVSAIQELDSYKSLYSCNFVSLLVDWSINNNMICASSNRNYCENINCVLFKICESENYDELSNVLKRIVENYESTRNGSLVVLFDGIICKCKPENNLVNSDIVGIVSNVSLRANCDYLQELAAKLLGNVLNKTSETDLELYLSIVRDDCKTADAINSIYLISFIYKALIMRGYNNTDDWFNKLMEIVAVEERAARGFMYVMNDSYRQFSPECHCSRKLLYKQKFFVHACQLLMKNHQTNHNYLLAFGYLVSETPRNVLNLELDKIYSMIILSLDSIRKQDVLLALINTLSQLISDKTSFAEDHLQDLIPRFLQLSKFQDSMNVRIAALRCLKTYADGYAIYKLLPHKQDVVYGLIDAIDDKKRLVRKEAVETRSKWFLIDAPH